MLRILLTAVAACALASCGGDNAPSAALPVADCNKVETETIAFTAPDAQDVLETRSIGDRCSQAVVVMTIRKATGEALWAYATPHPWIATMEGSDSATQSAMMAAFLENWNAKADTTASLPDWPQRERVFTEQLGAFERSPFDRDAYLEIRSKAYPRLCYATGIESGECVYYDTSTGVVFKVYEAGA